MNVFIDTSILYDDPFWQNSYNKALLDRARNKRLNIFLSKVVIKELHRNFQKQVDELVKKISDSSREINRKFVVNKIPIFIPNRETLNENFL